MLEVSLQLRLTYLVAVQVSALLVAVPDYLPAPLLPRVERLAHPIDVADTRHLFQMDAPALDGRAIELPDIPAHLEIQVVRLEWQFDERLIQANGLPQDFCRKQGLALAQMALQQKLGLLVEAG